MTSSLRALGLRFAVLCALFGTVASAHAAVAPPSLPLALLDSFDQAFALVYEAAERKVAALEAAAPPPPRRDAFTMLGELAADVAVMCDTAAAALEVEIATAGSLSPTRRAAVLGCIERHLRDARRAVAQARDPEVRAEYEATCARLRDVRQLI